MTSSLPDIVKSAQNERWCSALQFVQLCSITLLYYDYSLTLADEINYIWKNPWRLTTLFYIFCRYSLAANLLYMLSISHKTTGVNCNTGYLICGVLSILGHAGVIAVWGLRTSAILDKNKYVSALLGILGSAVLIMLIIRAPFNLCSGRPKFAGIRGAISATMLTFDLLAFLFASVRAWISIRRDTRFWIDPKPSLNYVIFSQGLIYILPVCFLSVATLSLNWKVPITYTRLLSSLKLPLSGFLTARFILKLRKWEDQKRHLGPSIPGTSPSLPRWNAARSSNPQTSVLDELGSDVGPSSAELSEIHSRTENQYEAHVSHDEMRTATHRPALDIATTISPWKGKKRADGNEEELEVVTQSARPTAAQLSTPFSPLTSPSMMRNRTRVPPGSLHSSEWDGASQGTGGSTRRRQPPVT